MNHFVTQNWCRTSKVTRIKYKCESKFNNQNIQFTYFFFVFALCCRTTHGAASMVQTHHCLLTECLDSIMLCPDHTTSTLQPHANPSDGRQPRHPEVSSVWFPQEAQRGPHWGVLQRRVGHHLWWWLLTGQCPCSLSPAGLRFGHRLDTQCQVWQGRR